MIRYLDELARLELPGGSFAVFGSGPLAVRGLRENQDLDVLVTGELWEHLARKHPVESRAGKPDMIRIGHLQIMEVGYRSWGSTVGASRQLIDQAESIEGGPYVRLRHLLECKKQMEGEMHADDVRMIRRFLGG